MIPSTTEKAARMTSDGRVVAKKPLAGSRHRDPRRLAESKPRSGISGIVMGAPRASNAIPNAD